MELSTGPKVYRGLVFQRWSALRGLAVGGPLIVLTPIMAAVGYLLKWSPLVGIGFGCATAIWYVITLPIAMYDVWKDERLARNSEVSELKSEATRLQSQLSAKPQTLVTAIRIKAKEIDDFIDSIPDDEEDAFSLEFGLRFPRSDLVAYWRKIEGAIGDLGPIFIPAVLTKSDARRVSRNLKLVARRVPPDALF